ncbi:MAG: sigma-70 family RNA polymerase sigma factor [Bacilli bacterium]|nr:sigma-70 family RNA polymerase sigma factor [Bacilli bacterium]
MKDYKELKELVVENEALIYSIAKKFKGELDDLFQVGVIGLMKARENFNEKFNTKFTTYAYQYIYGEIYQYVLRNKNIRGSTEQIKLNTAINKATDYLSQKYGRIPSDSEIANFLEVPIEKIFENKSVLDTISLDDDRNEVDLYNFIPSVETNKDDLITLRDALNKLSREEKELILKRYFYNMTQSEIAKSLGTNQVKISREEGKVLTKLREYM